ncbi:uncharacterized protein LOC123559971 [Mercenaria mercenaria]|uniref:uncharacterized protein LOC123559971 n=1 Tax=Mercenaria mercenaria TaxID=6596 RepID=UPI00234EA45E|nr:uncharacterized protein LOC123559971 [Mercenaria mercenaria]
MEKALDIAWYQMYFFTSFTVHLKLFLVSAIGHLTKQVPAQHSRSLYEWQSDLWFTVRSTLWFTVLTELSQGYEDYESYEDDATDSFDNTISDESKMTMIVVEVNIVIEVNKLNPRLTSRLYLNKVRKTNEITKRKGSLNCLSVLQTDVEYETIIPDSHILLVISTDTAMIPRDTTPCDIPLMQLSYTRKY